METAQTELRRIVPPKAARWVRREQFHLTLKFLGNVPVSRVDELIKAGRRACQSCSPLQLRAREIGFFPNARAPRVVWVGISDLEDRLAAVWKAVQSATQSFTRESVEAEFTGHVTLARVIGSIVMKRRSWPVQRASLERQRLGSGRRSSLS